MTTGVHFQAVVITNDDQPDEHGLQFTIWPLPPLELKDIVEAVRVALFAHLVERKIIEDTPAVDMTGGAGGTVQ